MKRLLVLIALVGALATIAIPAASASVRVLPLSSQQFGWTYQQWNAVYTKRLFERDFRSHHALLASHNGDCGQRVGGQEHARMLPTPFDGLSLSASCRIRPGTYLVVGVNGVTAFYAGPKKLSSLVDRDWADVVGYSLTVDGHNLAPHVLKTPFLHARLPYYNAQVIGLPKTTVSYVVKDAFAILSPLSRGHHTLVTSMTFDHPGELHTDSMTFHLNVR